MARVNARIREGFCPRLDYSRSRTPTCPKVFLTRHPDGRTIKVLIGMIGDQLVETLQAGVCREFPHKGELLSRLRYFCPFLDEFYSEHGGEATEKVVYNRYHKMYYRNSSPRHERGAKSREHYEIDPKLRRILPAVNDLFVRGRPITREEATIAGATLVGR